MTERQQRNRMDRSNVMSNAETQPNSNAPALRNDRERREWIEAELDLCNQVGRGGWAAGSGRPSLYGPACLARPGPLLVLLSRHWLKSAPPLLPQSWVYQKVLDGEIAQRSEAARWAPLLRRSSQAAGSASALRWPAVLAGLPGGGSHCPTAAPCRPDRRQLREVQKRLMMHDNLVPPSPLISGGAGPSRLQLEPRDVLQERQQALNQQVGAALLRLAAAGPGARHCHAPRCAGSGRWRTLAPDPPPA
jgi:hypothetical protein